jgi:hypothetical protein
MHQFLPPQSPTQFFGGLLIAVFISAIFFRIGFAFGEWMKDIQR